MSASTLPEVHFAGAPSAGGSAALTSEAEPAWAAARDTSDRSVLEAFISRFNDSFSAASPGSKPEPFVERLAIHSFASAVLASG
jgi:hypothetical protein